MIITVLIIPLSLPIIFIILFYLASNSPWFMALLHLSAVGHWQGLTGSACVILLAAVSVLNLIALLLTALFAAILNRRLHKRQPSPTKME